jgi:hypothetical protein
VRILALGLVTLLSPGLRAQPDDPGSFRVVTATHDLVDGVYYINAQLYLRLSTEARSALRAVPLTIRVEVEFLNRLRFWWDNTEVQKVQEYQLEYRSIPDRYVVRDMQVPDKQTPFASLADALDFVGRIDNLPVVDEAVLDDDRRYDVRIRAVLDKSEVPCPLCLIAFFRRDFSIGSEWFEWRLDDE